jgi:Zn-dependent M28 family amino/carboxypeptidase
MKKTAIILLSALFAASLSLAQDLTASFDGPRMLERVKRLSADDFEGRGPGTEGGKRAAQYIADQLRGLGAKPANGKSYLQNVPLIGVKADPNTKLNASGGGKSATFRFGDDFVATTGAQSATAGVSGADLVFVGYGIDAPNYRWNDYKGDPSRYRGKVLLMMVNDPPATSSEPALFGGKALTYYGRWTYKYEEAARRGAAGVILIHTNESAGYGWNVVRTSNGNWRYEIRRSSKDKTPFLQVKAWATNDTVEKILKLNGLDLDRLRRAAQSREFDPVDTGIKVDLTINSEFKRNPSPNVAGIVEGSDRKLRKEVVIYSAHWDHLGVGEADGRGDRIYNGAYDNASGVAALLGIAEVVAKMPVKTRPKRSFLFLFPTAEEQGLLGAEYYSLHPLVPLAKTAGNINVDGVNFFGKTRDFSALGEERSALGQYVREAARERSMTLEGDTRPEQGFFFRSDHFPFARVGVPAISVRHGDDFVTALSGEREEFFKSYTAKYYHQPSDEFKDWWDASSMVQEAELALLIGIKLANADSLPRYIDSDEFAAADKKRIP